MLNEVLAALAAESGGRRLDGTVGGGGHACGILQATGPDGWLYGCDRDGEAIEAAAQRLAPFAGRFELRRAVFVSAGDWIPEASLDGVVLDLGVSSPQLDRADRGFSFQKDGPLDMRMDPTQTLTAAQVVAEASETELADIFWKLGDERHARRVARAIMRERSQHSIARTRHLAEVVERALPRRGGRIHPATRVFQALRMAVNDELRLLETGLSAVWRLLRPGGRLAVITFHSLEDRLVKNFGRELCRDYATPNGVDIPELRVPSAPRARWTPRKPIRPSPNELEANPRSRSAQLRVLEKI